METRINAAIERYLEMRGAEVLDHIDDNILVVQDDEGIAFTEIAVSDFGEEVSLMTRNHFELLMFEWFKEHEEASNDIEVRYDVIIMNIVSNSRGLIKHVINADLV